jgi:uncharacterized protein (TIGR03435 family)
MNIDEVVKRYLPSAPEERIKSGTTRVLHELRTRPRLMVEPVAKPVHSIRWNRFAMIPAAAAVVLAVFVGLLWRQDALAIGEGEDGSVYRIGDTVRAKDGLTINLKDGTRVEVKSESELSFEGKKSAVQIHLAHGGVIVNSQSSSVVRTKDVRVPVAGTVLVNAESGGSRVAVIQGEARVQQGSTEKRLRPGEQMATNPLMELQTVSQEIAWSSRAETHLALLQQSNPPAVTTRDVFDVISIRSRAVSNNGGVRGAAGENSLPSGGPCAGRLQLDPSRFAVTNAGLYYLITLAYSLDEPPFSCSLAEKTGVINGGPNWIQSTGFDIEAVIPAGVPALLSKEALRGRAGNATTVNVPGSRLRNMIRAMLEDRFKLTLRRETKDTSAYILSIGKDGPKNLQPWKEGEPTSTATGYGDYEGVVNFNPPKKNYGNSFVGYISGYRVNMDFLARSISSFLNKPVLNRTNVAGNFNFEVFFAPPDPDRYARSMAAGAAAGYKPYEGMVPLQSPTMAKALEEDLGLKLESVTTPVEVFTIQSVDKPSGN